MKTWWWPIIIIGLAALLYFFRLERADIITDESSYATRSIGLVDFDFGIAQPTSWEWVSRLPEGTAATDLGIPWWMRLSFHDHPPLVFLLQHFSIALFDENPTAIRIPSALAGIASVIFVYLIGKRLYSPTVGAISALLFAVTANHVWISRIGLFESLTIAFILASFWAFLKGLEHPRWLSLTGAFLSFAFLTKYTSLILIPIFLTILLVKKRSYFTRHKFYFLFSIFLFLAIASPVIIYNIQLYRNFGHFDFQFSQLLHQNVKEWQSHPGQEVLGSYGDRIRAYIPRLVEANSPYFLILSVAGLVAIFWELIRRRTLVISHWSLVIVFIWLLPFIVFIGPAHRFLTLLTPWFALAAGYLIAQISYSQILKNLRIALALLAALIIAEAAYAYNSVIALDPVGEKPWAYAAALRRQSHAWGFNELNAYLDVELKGKMPDPAITFECPFAHELLNEARAEGLSRGLAPTPVGIVYNDNINLAAQLWVFLRRIVYHGWPVANAEDFRRGGADQFFRQSGVRQIYFINPTEVALQDRTRPSAPDGDLMESELRTRGAVPVEIRNPRGGVAFRMYKFELR